MQAFPRGARERGQVRSIPETTNNNLTGFREIRGAPFPKQQ